MSEAETIDEVRLNVRVKGPMAGHVNKRIGPAGLYESHSEYVRDLIRRDMHGTDVDLRQQVTEAYADLAEGRVREVSQDEIFERALNKVSESGIVIHEGDS